MVSCLTGKYRECAEFGGTKRYSVQILKLRQGLARVPVLSDNRSAIPVISCKQVKEQDQSANDCFT
jgi:hypothetical protein